MYKYQLFARKFKRIHFCYRWSNFAIFYKPASNSGQVHPGNIVFKFGVIWPSGFLEEDDEDRFKVMTIAHIVQTFGPGELKRMKSYE